MLRRRLFPRRSVVLVLLLIVALGGGARAYHAANPTQYQSTDERAYARIALGLAVNGRYGDPSLHWPPGAPVVFAAAYKLFPNASTERHPDIRAAYWFQAVIGVATILAAFLLAAVLGGPVAGLVAAAVVAGYPPLIYGTAEMLSEPLGALTVTLAVLGVVWAWRSRSLPAVAGRFAATGVLFGIAVLVRADLLPVPFLVAGVVALLLLVARAGIGRSLLAGAALALGTVLALAPWSIQASGDAGKFVPVTDGAGPALFVGTFLPGNGNQAGMKRALEAQIKRRNPRLRDVPVSRLKSASALRTIAQRNPGMERNDSLQREARKNIVRYSKEQPRAFASMLLDKIPRIWMRYSHGRGRDTEAPITVLHVVIVLLSALGLLAGLIRWREPALAVILTILAGSTALHMLTVAIPRYNVPLMPILIAGGAAGVALALRGRAAGGEADPGGSSGPARHEPAPEGATAVLAPAGPAPHGA